MKSSEMNKKEKEDKLLIYLSDKGIDVTKLGVGKTKEK